MEGGTLTVAAQPKSLAVPEGVVAGGVLPVGSTLQLSEI